MKSLRTFLSEKKTPVYVAGSVGAGVFIGWLLFHSDKRVEYRETTKTEYVDKIEYRDRVVEKVVRDTSSDRKQNVRIVTKYIERPDGTKETTREEVTDTHETENTKTVLDKTRETEVKQEVVMKTETQIEKVETSVMKNWHLSASAGLTTSGPVLYGAQLERRFIGPVFLGVRADTNPSVSVVAGFDF
jgi:hypothetical protein